MTIKELKSLTACFFLGIGSGLPLALVSSTLQAWYTVSGVDIISIGFLGLVSQPYMYKFIWAPYLDKYRLNVYLSYRKDWIVLMQCCLFISCFALSFFEPKTHPLLIAIIAMIIATFSATQDIAIDAYRTEMLNQSLRGLGAAIANTGYRLGMIVSGGFALILADRIGWQLTYQINAFFIFIGLIGIVFGPVIDQQEKRQIIHYSDAFKNFFKRKQVFSLLAVILCYRLGESFTSSLSGLVTTFLLRELGLTLSTVGIMTKIVGISMTVFGGLLGGFLMMRLSLYKALLYFGYLQAISNLLFILLAKLHPHFFTVACVIGIENLCSGLGTAAFITFLMSLCQAPFTASQYALFSAIAAVSRIVIGPLSGYIIYYFSWESYFMISFIASLPALFMIVRLKDHLRLA